MIVFSIKILKFCHLESDLICHHLISLTEILVLLSDLLFPHLNKLYHYTAIFFLKGDHLFLPLHQLSSVSSVTHSYPILCDIRNYSMPGFPVHHQLLEFAQTHVHQVSDAIQPSHPLSSPSPPAFKFSQHQDPFQ